MNVPYDAKGDGGTILVPADQVTKLRMELAQDNLPAAGVGYEIFDKSDAFGTTAFVQNINRLRALEGELARSIQTIEGIESARVHLVVPERQIFARDNQPPSASVVLKTRTRDRPRPGRRHPASGRRRRRRRCSPSRVAIVDDQGNLLAGGDDKTGADATAADQEQSTTDYEDRMRQRVESIVASVVGAGHVRVQVAADMDFNHIAPRPRPSIPTARWCARPRPSSRIRRDKSGTAPEAVSVANALPTPPARRPAIRQQSHHGRTEETTNYEISKNVTTSTQDGGDVKHLSVAVVVDGTVTGERRQCALYAAHRRRDDPDHRLVKSAIGFDKARGDQVQVTNMRFARLDVAERRPRRSRCWAWSRPWFKIIEASILSLTALLIGLFVVRPLIRRMFAPIRRRSPADPAGRRRAGRRRTAARRRRRRAPRRADAGRPRRLRILPAQARAIDISQIEGQVREFIRQENRRSRHRASRRSAGDHSHLAASTGIRTWQKPAKPAVKEDMRSLSGAERAAIIMLSLGEEHSAKLWQMMDEEEIKEISQVMSNLGTVSSTVVEKLLVDFVSQMSGTGSLMGSYESTERLLARFLPGDKVVPDHGGNPRSRRPHHVGQARQRERKRARELSEERISADRRGRAVQDQAGTRRARAGRAAGGIRAGSACSACCAWKACRRTFSTRSSRPCASSSCPTWRAPPSATPTK